MAPSLVDVTGRARIERMRRVIGAVAVLAILVLTLWPSGHRPSEPASFCVACGPRGLADGILNFWLFAPLGMALGWNARRSGAAIVFAFVLSMVIELTQTIVPGRDPSLSDVVFNTAGAAVGVLVARRPRVWLVPEEEISRLLAAISTVTVGAVMVATALLLSPMSSSSSVAGSGDDLGLRYATRAGALGLDEPEHGVRAVTIGQGWTLLAYPDALGRRWGRVLNALWVCALCFPIGFWARGGLLLPAATAIALLLALIPAVTGITRTSAEEWAGAAIGLAAGAMLGVLSNRLAKRSGQLPSTALPR